MTLTYIRPDADDTDGTWTNEADSNSNLFASIDETVANDTDYIKSAHLPDHDICKIRLSDPSGMVMRPATVHYRFKKKGEASTQINLDVSLLQGATEIAKWSESDIGTSYVDGSQALTVPQFNAITDFTDLYLQFDAFSAWWLAGSSIDLDFASGLYYDSGAGGAGQVVTDYLSCSRASVGYATTSSGTLTQFGTDTLRITDLGLLVEDARTNVNPYSDDLNNWTHPSTTVSANATTAPDGTATADKLVSSSSNVAQGAWRSLTGSGQSTWTIYAKAAGYNFACLSSVASADRYTIVVDLTNGSITQAAAATGSPTGVVTSVETLASGWYRLRVTMDQTPIEQNISVSNTGTPSIDANGLANFTGDGSSGVYFWGGQVESGAFPSSYIPTTTGSATRAAEAIDCIGSLNTIIGGTASPASVVVDVIASAAINPTGNVRILGVNGIADSIAYWRGLSGEAFASYNGSAELLAALGGSVTYETGAKVGASWNDSTPARSVVGGNGTVSTAATVIGSHSTVSLGRSGTAGEQWFGYYRRLTCWNTKLADATLQGFTNP